MLKKRLLALALACTMTAPTVASAFPASAAQTDDEPSGAFGLFAPSGDDDDADYGGEEDNEYEEYADEPEYKVYDAGGYSLWFSVDEDGNASVNGFANGTYTDYLVIPEKIDGHTVTKVGGFEISYYWSYDEDDLAKTPKTVKLPDTVTELSESAFSFCERLEKNRTSRVSSGYRKARILSV